MFLSLFPHLTAGFNPHSIPMCPLDSIKPQKPRPLNLLSSMSSEMTFPSRVVIFYQAIGWHSDMGWALTGAWDHWNPWNLNLKREVRDPAAVNPWFVTHWFVAWWNVPWPRHAIECNNIGTTINHIEPWAEPIVRKRTFEFVHGFTRKNHIICIETSIKPWS